MTRIVFLLAFFCLSTSSFSQGVPKKKLYGEWISGDDECPDVLHFKSNGIYQIANDCYGTAPTMVIETGKWSLNDDNVLALRNRVYTAGSGYTLWRESSSFTFKVALGKAVLNLSKRGRYRRHGVVAESEVNNAHSSASQPKCYLNVPV